MLDVRDRVGVTGVAHDDLGLCVTVEERVGLTNRVSAFDGDDVVFDAHEHTTTSITPRGAKYARADRLASA